jgi:hypothetical protein
MVRFVSPSHVCVSDSVRAFLCQQKANAAAAQGPTLDQYNAEIQRLQIFLVSLNALQTVNSPAFAKYDAKTGINDPCRN